MKNYKFWTEEEDQYLKDYYTVLNLQELANHVGRSRSAVNSRGRKLNLTTTNADYAKYNIKWTTKQITYLKKYYSSKTNEQLSIKLGHSVAAIQTRAKLLKLTSNHKEWDKNELKLLKKLHTEYTFSELEQKLGRTKSSIERKAYRLGITHPKNRSMLEQDFAKFLTENIISFKEQVSVWKYRVDFIIGKYVVETHGTYWHCDSRVYPKGAKYNVQKNNIKNDLNKKKYLEKRGYTVLVVWEKDFYENKEQVKNTIVPLLRNQ